MSQPRSQPGSISQRLAELNLTLPSAPQAVGQYHPWLKTGNLIFVSGQFPIVDGVLQYSGRLGADLSDQEGYKAAQMAALNVLAQLSAATREFQDLASIVRVEGHFQSAPDWYAHAPVLDSASELFAAVLGDRAGHTRTAFSHITLPLNSPIELVVTAAVQAS